MTNIESFKRICDKYKIADSDILSISEIGQKLNNSKKFLQKEKLRSQFRTVISQYSMETTDSVTLGIIFQKINITKENIDLFKQGDLSNEKLFESPSFNLENEKKESKNLLRNIVIVFILVSVAFFFLFRSCAASDEITGTSDKSYLQMAMEVGCTSSNSDDKKEDIFKEQYKNKWMTFVGVVEGIDGDVLSINCDMQGVSDVRIEFDDEKSIYEIKKGTLIKVKFAMRKIGGCIESFQGDKGEIVQKDLSMSEMQNEMFKK